MSVALRDVCKLIVDSEHKTAPSGRDGHPMIRTPNIGPGRFELEGVLRVEDDVYHQWTKRAVPQEGDLILAREAPVGNVAMIPVGMRPILGQRTVLIRPDRDVVEPRYLQYLLLGKELQHKMQSLTTGATVPHLNMRDIRSLDLPALPDILTQRKVAAVMAAYDELIENNLWRIEILEEMVQAIYREWFVNFRYPDHEAGDLVDSPLGPIPEGWELGTLAEVAEVNAISVRKGSAPAEINYIDISSVSPRSVDAIKSMPFEEAPSRARRVVRSGDIIWSTVRPNRRSFALVLDPPENTIASTGFAVLTPTTVPYSYFYSAVGTHEFSSYLTNHARGAAYPAVNTEDFEKATLLCAPGRLLDAFHERTAPMLKLVQVLTSTNRNLRTTRDLLLPKLISGAIDVSELDIDTAWLAA